MSGFSFFNPLEPFPSRRVEGSMTEETPLGKAIVRVHAWQCKDIASFSTSSNFTSFPWVDLQTCLPALSLLQFRARHRGACCVTTIHLSSSELLSVLVFTPQVESAFSRSSVELKFFGGFFLIAKLVVSCCLQKKKKNPLTAWDVPNTTPTYVCHLFLFMKESVYHLQSEQHNSTEMLLEKPTLFPPSLRSSFVHRW